MRNTFDVILIGGGIMGCCTGYELSSRGLSVAIVEKGKIGEGPTGDSAAIIRQHYSNRLTAQMAHYGVGVFSRFEDLVGERCGFVQSGFAVLASDSHKMQIDSKLILLRDLEIDTRVIPLEELRELIPGAPMKEGVICVYEPKSGYADAVQTVQSFTRAAVRLGAELFEDTEVQDIRFDSGKVSGVATSSGKLSAPCVINCGGAWGARIAAMSGVSVPINSCRAQVAILNRPDSFVSDFPVVIDLTNGSFIRPYSKTDVFGGLVDPTESEAIVDPDDYSRQPDANFLESTFDRLGESWPELKHSASISGYASLYAITPDWHPIIDELPGGSGFYICSGFSGHGFKLAPAVGRMTADMVTRESDPLFDRTAFRLSRFTESAGVEGSYKYSILG